MLESLEDISVVDKNKSFPTCRNIMMTMKQTTFEIIAAKEKTEFSIMGIYRDVDKIIHSF